jgi:NAD(P)-dependent dehydrogenase (short-subunit alcohol dehydrogenase family)
MIRAAARPVSFRVRQQPSVTMAAVAAAAPPTLIFGATGGIGAALARRLAAAGRSLHLSARDPGKLQALASEIGAAAAATAGDLRVPGEVERVAAAAGPRLAGLVFAVGSIDLGPLKRLGPELFAEAFALNVTAAAMAVRAGLPALVAGEGAVVLFSSVAAGTGFRNHAVTGSVKAAVEGLARALAAELAPKVRVNCVAPTLTRTPLAAALTGNPQLVEGIARQHPLGRIAEADDIAGVAELLLGPAGGFMTGQVLHVDGGRSSVAG